MVDLLEQAIINSTSTWVRTPTNSSTKGFRSSSLHFHLKLSIMTLNKHVLLYELKAHNVWLNGILSPYLAKYTLPLRCCSTIPNPPPPPHIESRAKPVHNNVTDSIKVTEEIRKHSPLENIPRSAADGALVILLVESWATAIISIITIRSSQVTASDRLTVLFCSTDRSSFCVQ